MSLEALIHRSMMGGKAATRYITNGLVFWLDGADATLSKWVDKVGGIEFAMNNVSLDGNGGVVFDGTAYGNHPNNLDFPSSTHTIEIVLNYISSGMRVAFMINAADMLAFGYSSGGDYIVTKSGNSNFRSTWNTGSGLATYSVTNSAAYKNGASMSYRGTDSWFLRTGGTFVGARSSTDSLFKGTIYQIRIYNRFLSNAEVMHNQICDIKRYNIL